MLLIEKSSTEIIHIHLNLFKYDHTINTESVEYSLFYIETGCIQAKCWWMPFHRDRNMHRVQYITFFTQRFKLKCQQMLELAGLRLNRHVSDY